jgi:transcriptional regulator with XRE-family HTH domain
MKKIEQIRFGIRLKELRLERRKSVEEMADLLDVDCAVYRGWEEGEALAGLPYDHLAQAFGIGLPELMAYDGQNVELTVRISEIERSLRDM